MVKRKLYIQHPEKEIVESVLEMVYLALDKLEMDYMYFIKTGLKVVSKIFWRRKAIIKEANPAIKPLKWCIPT